MSRSLRSISQSRAGGDQALAARLRRFGHRGERLRLIRENLPELGLETVQASKCICRVPSRDTDCGVVGGLESNGVSRAVQLCACSGDGVELWHCQERPVGCAEPVGIPLKRALPIWWPSCIFDRRSELRLIHPALLRQLLSDIQETGEASDSTIDITTPGVANHQVCVRPEPHRTPQRLLQVGELDLVVEHTQKR